MVFIAFFAILFTKKWPKGMFDFMVQIQRWTANVAAYAVLLLRDEYPPFSGDAGEYPVTLEIDYDVNLSRWQIFLKWLFVIPNLFVLLFVLLAAYVVVFIAFFAILFTGRYPRGMFDFVVGVLPLADARQRVRAVADDRSLPAVQPEVERAFAILARSPAPARAAGLSESFSNPFLHLFRSRHERLQQGLSDDRGADAAAPAVSQVMAEPILYHRAPAFIEIYARVPGAA